MVGDGFFISKIFLRLLPIFKGKVFAALVVLVKLTDFNGFSLCTAKRTHENGKYKPEKQY